jgi:hypothetical protein
MISLPQLSLLDGGRFFSATMQDTPPAARMERRGRLAGFRGSRATHIKRHGYGDGARPFCAPSCVGFKYLQQPRVISSQISISFRPHFPPKPKTARSIRCGEQNGLAQAIMTMSIMHEWGEAAKVEPDELAELDVEF